MKQDLTQFQKASQVSRLTHQGYAMILSNAMPLCDACALMDRCPDYHPGGEDCPFFTSILEGRIRRYMALKHIREEDTDLVVLFCKHLTTIDFINAWTSTVGPFKQTTKREGLDVAPVLRFRTQLESAATKLARELILTPSARRAMELEDARRPEEFDVDQLLEDRAAAQGTTTNSTPEDRRAPRESSPLL